ncbi:hypothetical protein WIS52_10310 [Pseudonocardia nematodicida]|uniref:Uncharacterized protein n=1 Tax=Pseudonocardia nematodicida TaxID=1206997 RepID=A0ABV1K8R3_9PSEU
MTLTVGIVLAVLGYVAAGWWGERAERAARAVAEEALPGGLRVLQVEPPDPVNAPDGSRTVLAVPVDDPDAAVRFPLPSDGRCDATCLEQVRDATELARGRAVEHRVLVATAAGCGLEIAGVTGIDRSDRRSRDADNPVLLVGVTVVADVRPDAGAALTDRLDRCAADLVAARARSADSGPGGTAELDVSVVAPDAAGLAEPVDPALPAVERAARSARAVAAQVRHATTVTAGPGGEHPPSRTTFGPVLDVEGQHRVHGAATGALRWHLDATDVEIVGNPRLRDRAVYLPGTLERARFYTVFGTLTPGERLIGAVDVDVDGADPVVARVFAGSEYAFPYDPDLHGG